MTRRRALKTGALSFFTRHLKPSFFLLVLFTGLLPLGLPAHAAAWNVTSAADPSGAPVEGTLRYAVRNAANNDIVTFERPGMEILLWEELLIDKTISLLGNSTVIRQTAPHHRVCSVASGSVVLMENLTITGGKAYSGSGGGGGIQNKGVLTLRNCVLRDNFASAFGGALENYGKATLDSVTLEYNTARFQGGGICNRSAGTLDFYASIMRDNSSDGYGGGLTNFGVASLYSGASLSGNSALRGGGIYNDGTVTASGCIIRSNGASESSAGGGVESYGIAFFSKKTVITGNTPLQIFGSYTTDDTCVIGTNCGRSSVALAGMASGVSPESRSTAGAADVRKAEGDLGDSGSTLFGAVKEALSHDLGGISGNLSAALEGMNATLYNAFAYENIPLEEDSGSGELQIEFTASWPKYARYYAAFALGEEEGQGVHERRERVPGSYVLPERGIQFEISPGQELPEEVVPPKFYESGEGLRTWRIVVADNGSFDLASEAGKVTFRVCSVRAEAQPAPSGGGSGGCDIGAASPWLFLLLVPGLFTVLRRERERRK